MRRLTAALLVLLASSEVAAFSLRKSDEGVVIHWKTNKVTIILDDSLGLLGDLEPVEETIKDSFYTWADDSEIPLEFVFERGKCKKAGYENGNTNKNCIMAADDTWTNENKEVGATTIVTFKPRTGEIVDADIVFNAKEWRWTTDGSDPKALSVAGVATHEIGHLIGLGHSEVEAATMYPMTRLGETAKLSLHADDIAGAEQLYSQVWSEAGPEGDTYGCQVISAGLGSGSQWAALTLFFWIAFLVRALYRPVRCRVRAFIAKR